MAYIGKREAGNNKRGPNDTSGVILGPRYVSFYDFYFLGTMTICPGHHEKEQQMTTTANCPMRVGQGQWGLEVHLCLKPPGIFLLFFPFY